MTTDGMKGSSDRAVLVLTSLAGGSKHGYALTKDIEEFAGVRLGPGTLYGAIAKLEQSGFVSALPADGRRFPYEITEDGRNWLQERLADSARVAAVGLHRLGSALS